MKKYLIFAIMVLLIFAINFGCSRPMNRSNPLDPGNPSNLSTSSTGSTTTTSAQNNAPNTPASAPTGTGTYTILTNHTFNISATDTDGDQVKYRFDWGDGITTDSGLVNSGVSLGLSHTWATAGDFSVRVRTIDEHNALSSGWSPVLNVSVIDPAAGYDSYTKLILHFEGTNGGTAFSDSSPYTKTVAGVNNGAGLPTTSTTRSKFGSSSLYIPGTGINGNDAWVTVAASQDFNTGAGNFTVDFWYYHVDITDPGTLFGYSGSTSGSQGASYYGMALYCGFGSPTTKHNLNLNASSTRTSWDIADDAIRADVLTINAWNHIAVVRNGNTWSVYVNGNLYYSFVSSATLEPNSGLVNFNIGHWGGHGLNCLKGGYIDEFRFSKGIARWTANFTPPVAAYN